MSEKGPKKEGLLREPIVLLLIMWVAVAIVAEFDPEHEAEGVLFGWAVTCFAGLLHFMRR